MLVFSVSRWAWHAGKYKMGLVSFICWLWYSVICRVFYHNQGHTYGLVFRVMWHPPNIYEISPKSQSPKGLWCRSTFDPKQTIILCIQYVKKINNWVQIVNSKTSRMPQFHELGFCQILNENKSEVFIFNV